MDTFFSRGIRCTVHVGWTSSRSKQASSNISNENSNSNMSGICNPHNKPTRLLAQRIRDRSWDTVRLRILTHPWDASYRTKEMNDATVLHLACLYRAPKDVVELILDANPEALFCVDSEGWSPLHVCLLYGGDDQDETALMLIRRGGSRVCSIQSHLIGSPLHLACRHGASTTIIREILTANPSMVSVPNVHRIHPAKMLWHYFSRDPENERFLYKAFSSQEDMVKATTGDYKTIIDLMDRLKLLIQAGKPKHNKSTNENSLLVHDILKSSTKEIGDLSKFLSLAVLLFPDQVHRVIDEFGNLPLHRAVSNLPTTISHHDKLIRSLSLPTFTSTTTTEITDLDSVYFSKEDPVDVLLQSFPIAARISNHQGSFPLHVALVKGRRTWRTGVASIVLAAPEVLMIPDVETNLFPFALAAINPSRNDEDEHVEIIETILELLLACPHALFHQ